MVGQPFDVVKVRYQTPEYNGRYASITQAFSESSTCFSHPWPIQLTSGAIVREEKVCPLSTG